MSPKPMHQLPTAWAEIIDQFTKDQEEGISCSDDLQHEGRIYMLGDLIMKLAQAAGQYKCTKQSAYILYTLVVDLMETEGEQVAEAVTTVNRKTYDKLKSWLESQ